MITFRCPNAQCPKTFSVKDESGGKKTKCPTCGALIVVPIPQELHPEPSPSSQVVPVVSTPPPLQSRTSPTAPTIAVNPARSEPRKRPELLDSARTLWKGNRNRALIGAIVGGVLLLMFLAALAAIISNWGMAQSPSSVVKAFYKAANDGRYSDAEGMLSKEAKDAVNGPLGQLAGGFKGICDKNTKNGTISTIEVVSEEVRGEGATVIVTLYYKDGTERRNDKNGLIRRDGRWQLTIGE